mgnify:CR=1 FL=1|jgi:hypothetical protein|tara:strand:- start:2438 stop:2875 length:438 start_codon:yes stop_codon:yes gene_type:complete
MDNTKKYDETNRGVLFNISSTDGEPDWKLIQQGKININGDQLRIIGIKRLNQKGEEIVELYRAMGTLKKADQVNEKDPYAKGVVNALVDKGAMIISGWKEQSERGNKYISLRLRDFSDNTGYETKQENPDIRKDVDTSALEDIDW